MIYTKQCSIADFPAWGQAVDTINTIVKKGDTDKLEQIVTYTLYTNDFCIPTENAVNDFLRFEQDYIAQELGYEDWEDYCE